MSIRKKKNNYCAVDLFCGAGGLTYGLQKEGIDVRAGLDLDPQCQYPFEKNNNSEFLLKDIDDIDRDELDRFYPKGSVKILVGCAPCQPFSTYTQGHDSTTDRKWRLLDSFARIVEEVQPDIVSMENVPQLGKYGIFADFVSTLKKNKYWVTFKTVFCPDYGIPQTRKRLVLLASRFSELKLIPPTHDIDSYKTVRDTIGHLEKLKAGEISEKDKLHQSSHLSDLNLRRIKASKPGGTWRDWNKNLIAACHTVSTGKTYPGVYGRMEWDKPSPTMTTQCFGFGNGRFGHPEQNRAISLREAALLQTFPEGYRFDDPKYPANFKATGRLIGNAVPVELGRVIGRSIVQHLEKTND